MLRPNKVYRGQLTPTERSARADRRRCGRRRDGRWTIHPLAALNRRLLGTV